MVDQGEIGKIIRLLPGRLIYGGEIFQTAESRLSFSLQELQNILEADRVYLKGRHIRGGGFLPDRLPEPFRQGLAQGLLRLGQLNPPGRRGPHELRPALPKTRRGNGGAPQRRALITGSPGVPSLADPIHQDRLDGALVTAVEVENGAGGAFLPDFLLQQYQALEQGFGPGRAAGDVDVHGQDLVHALDHAVDVIHAAAVGTGAHGDDPLGLRHLLIEPEHHRGLFF